MAHWGGGLATAWSSSLILVYYFATSSGTTLPVSSVPSITINRSNSGRPEPCAQATSTLDTRNEHLSRCQNPQAPANARLTSFNCPWRDREQGFVLVHDTTVQWGPRGVRQAAQLVARRIRARLCSPSSEPAHTRESEQQVVFEAAAGCSQKELQEGRRLTSTLPTPALASSILFCARDLLPMFTCGGFCKHSIKTNGS